MQTRHDLEFMADALSIIVQRTVDGLLPTWLLAKQVAEGMRDPITNTIAQRRMAAIQLALPCAIGPQTRHDLEFVADCLGTVEQRTVGGLPGMRPRQRYGFIPTAMLARAVAEGLVSPAASARVHNRIADLLCELPPVGYYAPARHERQRPPFRGPESAPVSWKTEANPWNVVPLTPVA